MKKVSIIIPAYNAASTLEKCYQSILAQTYSNFEVITVNDGSKDNTLEIMQKYSAQDKRFVSVDKPNGGVSSARNEGLKYATGTYLQFVDADDTLDSQMLEKMVNMIRKNRSIIPIYFVSMMMNAQGCKSGWIISSKCALMARLQKRCSKQKHLRLKSD